MSDYFGVLGPRYLTTSAVSVATVTATGNVTVGERLFVSAGSSVTPSIVYSGETGLDSGIYFGDGSINYAINGSAVVQYETSLATYHGDLRPNNDNVRLLGRSGNAWAQVWANQWRTLATDTTDTAPTDDTTVKRLTLQKRAAPPTNAAYVAFSNNPGTDVFYLALVEG